MFDYTSNIRSRKAIPCTPDMFDTVIRSTRVGQVCAEIADYREKKLRGEMSREDFETKKAELKRQLPAFLFHAHYSDGHRSNASAIPSGLSIYDIDHIEQIKNPKLKIQNYDYSLGEVLRQHVLNHQPITDTELIHKLKALGIVLAHISPSGEGLRLVFILADGMDLTNGQKWLANKLGDNEFDEACKDLARCSFAVPEDYILYIDKEALFKDRNPQQSGNPQQAINPHQASPKGRISDYQTPGVGAANSDSPNVGAANSDSPKGSTLNYDSPGMAGGSETAAPTSPSRDGNSKAAQSVKGNQKPPLGGGLEGTPDSNSLRIFDETVRAANLTLDNLNAIGTRHNSLITVLSMGICRLMPQEQLRAVIAERMPEFSKEKDCQDLIRDFYAKYTDPNRPMSGRLRRIYTDSLKNDKSAKKVDKDEQEIVDIDPTEKKDKENASAQLSAKIFRLLPMGLKDSLIGIPDTMRMPVLCSILPLAAAYADGVTVRYCDGMPQRLGLMSIIVGPQASGKSACKSKIDLWMRQMEDEDARAREIEDKWKQAKKSRKANEKAPEDPCVLIRSVPVTISCSTLLRRFKNSRGHCLFSFGEELDTLRKTNGAGSWSSKYDIYRLAFDNGKWGQDYNSDNAESGVVEVAYNFSILGTYGALRKCFRGDNVENGLSSRIIVAEMPDSAFAPMPTYGQSTADVSAAIDKAVTLLRSQTGFIDTPRLRRAIGKWVEEKRLEAMADGDLVKDTYRKRAAVIGFRCGVIARLLEGKESKSVLQFATMMAQYVLDEQCKIFGPSLNNEYKQASEEQERFSVNGTVFDTLPPVFTLQDIQQLKGPSATRSTLYTIISRWKKAGWIQKTGVNQWRKGERKTAV